jgi:hypothetical protein
VHRFAALRLVVVGVGPVGGVGAEQVMQLVAAGRGLGERVLVIQVIEVLAGLLHGGAIQRSAGVGVDVRTGGQAEPAEQPLRAGREVLVGQVKCGGDRQILRPHHGQPVPGLGQVSGQPHRGPGGVVAQLGGYHPDRQRQVPAQAGNLPHRGVPPFYPPHGLRAGPAVSPPRGRAGYRG